MTPRAFVDVGSNSVRCFLPDHDPPIRTTRVIGLRRGAGPDGSLARDALARLDQCLGDIATAVVGIDPIHRVAFATSAVRDAPNRGAACDLVRQRLGTRLHILTGTTEARLAFRGAYSGLGLAEGAVVIDPGGGSTELVAGDLSGVLAGVSLQLGAVRDTEHFLHSDPPTAIEVRRLRTHARELLTQAAGDIGWNSEQRPTVVGVAGTITTLASIVQGGYDPLRVHNAVLTASSVTRISHLLARLPAARRAELPGLHPDRAPVIVAGAVIVDEALAVLRADRLIVSEYDILDGAAADPAVVSGS